MARLLDPGPLVIASHNAGKVREIRELLAPYGIEPVSAAELGLPSPEETETTFAGNAALKAHASAQGANLPALADDSGIEIDALGGAPGVYAADWAEPTPGAPRDFAYAMERVERELAAVASANRTARFVCCLCLAWPDGHAESFLGKVDGSISFPPRGTRGFGYDPIFQPVGYSKTFAQLSPEAKNNISHRGKAIRAFVDFLMTQ